MNEVKVTATDGHVIVPSENNEAYGYARVSTERLIVDELTGFVKTKKVSALVPGLVTDLEKLGWKDNQVIGGKIVIREQMDPFFKEDPAKDLKIAGDTEVVCKVGENPIYRKTFWNPNPNALDVLIAHTNSDEIRAAQAEKASRFSLSES